MSFAARLRRGHHRSNQIMNRFIFAIALLTVPGSLLADDSSDCKCNRCGCQAHCQKVCRVVCEMKEVKVTCYCCKEEDICIPGHSRKCGEICEPNPCCLARPADCDCNCDDGNCAHRVLDKLFHENPCLIHETVWQPGCAAKMRSVNKLIKYGVSKKVPTYKWVTEYCCDHCRADIPATDKAPPPPVAMKDTVRQASAEFPLGTQPGSMWPAPLSPSSASPIDSQLPPAAATPQRPWDRLFQSSRQSEAVQPR